METSTVRKYPLTEHLLHGAPVLMPVTAQVMIVGEEGGEAYAWARVPIGDARETERHFVVLEPGKTEQQEGQFRGSLYFHGPHLLSAVYEVAS